MATTGPRPKIGQRVSGFFELIGPAGLFPLAVLFGLNLVDEFDRVAFNVLAPEIQKAFHLNDANFITIATLSAAVPILLAVPIGYLADRGNRVRIAIAAAAVWMSASVLTGLSWLLVWLVIARFVGGIGRLVNEPVHPSLLADYYPPRALPQVFAVHRVANNIGTIAAGPIAGGLAVLLGSWRPTFFFLAIPTIALVVLATRLKEPKRGGTLENPPDDAERIPFGEGFRRLNAIQTLKRTWLAAFFFGSGALSFGTFLSLFYGKVYHVGPGGRGLINSLFGVAGAIGLFVGAYLAKRAFNRGDIELLPLATALMVIEFGVGIFLMGVMPVMAGSLVFSFLLSVGASGFLPPYLTAVALSTPPSLRSQAYSYSLLFYALGGIVLSRIAAQFGTDHGFRAGLVMLSTFVTAGGLIGLTVRRFVARDIHQATINVSAQTASEAAGSLLVCRGVEVAYSQVQVLFGVDFDVKEGEIVTLLGTNGAGKSTLLKAISGLVDPIGGAIFFDGRDITHADANTTAGLGIVQIPGGRGIFPALSVADNLRASGWMYRDDQEYRRTATEKALDFFPVLRERYQIPAGNLSGGEQQMLSLAQAFMARPKLMLIDELSLGLAPTIVATLLDIVRALNAQGTTIVLVEQSVNTALSVADRAVFMEKGEVRFSGPARDLLDRPDVLRAVYLKTPAPTGSAKRRTGTEGAPVLQAFGLRKRYGGISAVDDADLSLHRGEILGLIGPNGAGKTTIFDLLSGFATLDSGRIYLNGEDVTGAPPAARARAGLGRSFQDSRLWHSLTVKEALAVALERHVEIPYAFPAMFGLPAVSDSEDQIVRRVEDVIELLSLGAFRDKFVGELSTGSRRLVEIAAILVQGPSVLLLDEPSSGLAQKESEGLGPLLQRVRDYLECSMLVIEHHIPLITSLADRMVALDQGRVIAEGTPYEVIRDRFVVESYLGAMAQEFLGGGSGAVRSDVRKRPKPKRTNRARGKV